MAERGEIPYAASQTRGDDVDAHETTREELVEAARESGIDIRFPTEGFHVLGGMSEAKDYLQSSLVAPLVNPGIAASFGIEAGARLLLWGPPGCGKTLFARAAAAEAKSALIAVQLADILGSYIGEDERNLALHFTAARSCAPCVLFFDEADSLAPRRNSPGMWEIERRMTNAFLQELDGAKGDNRGVAVVLATNQPWLMDPAVRRAGRVDGMLYVGLPDEPARAAIWGIALQQAPLALDVDVEVLGGLSVGLTGAEIAEVCRRATSGAFMHSVERAGVVAVRQLDLLCALSNTHARSADWFSAADREFCDGHHGASKDWSSAKAFNAPNRRRKISEALDACASEEAAGW